MNILQQALALPAKEALLCLQDTGEYVFHGTPEEVSVLEPRQAYNHGQKDGEPAVFASSYVEQAIFMAIFNKRLAHMYKIASFSSSMGQYNGILHYSVSSQEVLDYGRKDESFGYVAVLPKSAFTRNRGVEYCAYEPIVPLLVIKVAGHDLPDSIEVKTTSG